MGKKKIKSNKKEFDDESSSDEEFTLRQTKKEKMKKQNLKNLAKDFIADDDVVNSNKKKKNSNKIESENLDYLDYNFEEDSEEILKAIKDLEEREKEELSDQSLELVEDVSNFKPMLADTYNGSQNIDNWLLSEKLDGIRCIWNGKHLYSRNNNRFYPPEFFIKDFPKDIFLDGELFMSRYNFSETVSIVKKKEPHDGWKSIVFMVFDAPYLKGGFKSRIDQLNEKIKDKSVYIKVLNQELCPDQNYLDKRMDEITKDKGEGCIIRDPNSKYENKRSDKMLKVKKFLDAEATVIGIVKGTGRCEKMMGALEVKGDNGSFFKIGSGFDDNMRKNPPKIGSRVTYKYFELSKSGNPRFPIFLRVHPGV